MVEGWTRCDGRLGARGRYPVSDSCPTDDPDVHLATPEEMGDWVGLMAMTLDELKRCGGP